MAELLTTTQDTWTTVHPWYQLFKHRLHHIDVNHIIMVPNVPGVVGEDLRKEFKKEGMLVPIVINNNNLLIEGSRRLQYFKNEGSHVLAYKAKNDDEEKFLIELNKKFKEEGIPEIAICIGVNSCICIAGNFGATDRFAFSLIGDPCNVAARLESATKVAGVNVLIGEETSKYSNFKLKSLQPIEVKGKEKPLEVYTWENNYS